MLDQNDNKPIADNSKTNTHANSQKNKNDNATQHNTTKSNNKSYLSILNLKKCVKRFIVLQNEHDVDMKFVLNARHHFTINSIYVCLDLELYLMLL